MTQDKLREALELAIAALDLVRYNRPENEHAPTNMALYSAIVQARAALQSPSEGADAKDAARYRQLFAGSRDNPCVCFVPWDGYAIRLGKDHADKEIDAAIDAATKAAGEGK